MMAQIEGYDDELEPYAVEAKPSPKSPRSPASSKKDSEAKSVKSSKKSLEVDVRSSEDESEQTKSYLLNRCV